MTHCSSKTKWITAVGMAVWAWAEAQGQQMPAQSARQYIVYDGRSYEGSELARISQAPTQAPFPRFESGVYWIPRSADGHYYVNGFVNGHPVVFLIDTGATSTALPASLARNAGVRAAMVTTTNTAAGSTQASASSGNQVVLGPFTAPDSKILLVDTLRQPLLGMDVLNRFAISYANGAMTIRQAR